MSRKTDPAAEAYKVLVQINENLSRDESLLRFVSINFIKRGDYTCCVIHASDLDFVKPISVIGYGFSKRHSGCEGCGIPPDESDRSEGYKYAQKRAIDDTFAEYRKAVSKWRW